MVIEALQKKEKQTVMVLIFVIVVFLTIAVIFFGLLRRKKIVLSPSSVVPAYTSKTIEINFDILKSPALKDLEKFEKISLPETKGRENPFLPYSPVVIEE